MTILDSQFLDNITELCNILDEHLSESGERRRFMQSCSRLCSDDLSFLQSVLNGKLSQAKILEAVKSIKKPLRVTYSIFLLETFVESTNDKKLLFNIGELLSLPHVFKGLTKIFHFPWEVILLENRAIPKALIQNIWHMNKSDYLADPFAYYFLRMLVKLPNCPAEILEELVDYDDSTVRGIIARHRNASESIIRQYINSTRKPERMQVAISKHVSSEYLLSLMADKYKDITNAAKKNFKKRFPDLPMTQEVIGIAVRKYIDKPFDKSAPKKPQFNAYAVANKNDTQSVTSLKDSSQRKRVAKASSNSKLLTVLSKDKSKVVRRVVAENRLCPKESLLELVNDSDIMISLNALTNLMHNNSNLPIENFMSEDVTKKLFDVANRVINGYLKQEMLDLKKGSPKETEVKVTALILRFSHNTLIQHRLTSGLKKVPDIFQIHNHLLIALSDSVHLSDDVTNKLVSQLGFAEEKILLNCKNKDIISQYLTKPNIPAGVKARLENYFRFLSTCDSQVTLQTHQIKE